MVKFFRILRNIFFVPRCASCGTLLDAFKGELSLDCLCASCLNSWNMAKAELCPRCSGQVCMCSCFYGHANKSESLAKLVFYHPERECVQNKIIYTMKHTDDVRIFEFAASELSVSLCGILTDLQICPQECVFTWVPRRGRAISANGFDQGKRIACFAAKICGIKTGAESLFVRRGDKEQKTLGAKARIINASKHIKLKKRASDMVRNKTVVVIDDLITTGATVTYAGNLLKKAGAKKIVYAAAAQTLNKNITKKSENSNIVI